MGQAYLGGSEKNAEHYHVGLKNGDMIMAQGLLPLRLNMISIRVILVDDHPVVRAGIKKFLDEDTTIEVVAEADNAQAAEVVISRFQPDVLLLDIQMPDKSGIEVAKWTKEKFAEIGILILTAFDDTPYILAAIQAGANGYMLKTAPPEEIIRAVKLINDGKQAFGDQISEKIIDQLSSKRQSAAIEKLTDRELEVLSLVAKGFINKAIGLELEISDRTVQSHLSHVYRKLSAASRTDAVMKAISMGLISPK